MHIDVVACVPVPNAIPGSNSITISLSNGVYSSQDGFTTIFSPMRSGWKNCFQLLAQSSSWISLQLITPEPLSKNWLISSICKRNCSNLLGKSSSVGSHAFTVTTSVSSASGISV